MLIARGILKLFTMWEPGISGRTKIICLRSPLLQGGLRDTLFQDEWENPLACRNARSCDGPCLYRKGFYGLLWYLDTKGQYGVFLHASGATELFAEKKMIVKFLEYMKADIGYDRMGVQEIFWPHLFIHYENTAIL